MRDLDPPSRVDPDHLDPDLLDPDLDPDADVDPTDGRNETYNERLDRNWGEILQELRVTQSGTQILSGFLLSIVFQPKFDRLDHFQHTVYLVLVAVAGLTTALGLAPVVLHRELFRRRMKDTLVHVGDLLLRCTLVGIGLVLTGTQLLVFDVALSRRAGVTAAAITLAIVLAVALLPRLLRGRVTAPER